MAGSLHSQPTLCRRGTTMSWKATAFVKDLRLTPSTRRRITPAEKCLLYTLSDYFNDEEQCAWPSLPRIAEESCMSLRSATRLMMALEKEGVITIERQIRTTNRYRFTGYFDSAKLTLSKHAGDSAKRRVDSVKPVVNSATGGTRTKRTVIEPIVTPVFDSNFDSKTKPLTQVQMNRLYDFEKKTKSRGGEVTKQTCALSDAQWKQYKEFRSAINDYY